MKPSFVNLFLFAILTIIFWEVIADLLEISIGYFHGINKVYLLVILAIISSVLLYYLEAPDFTG